MVGHVLKPSSFAEERRVMAPVTEPTHGHPPAPRVGDCGHGLLLPSASSGTSSHGSSSKTWGARPMGSLRSRAWQTLGAGELRRARDPSTGRGEGEAQEEEGGDWGFYFNDDDSSPPGHAPL